MSLGHTRRFGGGIHHLHSHDNFQDGLSTYESKRILQSQIKASLEAVDNYKTRLQESSIPTHEPQEPQPHKHRYEELSYTSTKIGSSPAPSFNARKKQWIPWKASDFEKQQERDAIWQRLRLNTGIGASTLSGLHLANDNVEELNPITHLPNSSPGNNNHHHHHHHDNGHSPFTSSVSHTSLRHRAANLERSLSVPSFVPAKIQVLKQFSMEEFKNTSVFMNRKVRQEIEIELPISPVRRLHALVSPVRHTTTTKARPTHGGLIDLSHEKKQQVYTALIDEQKRNRGQLYENDVLCICNIYFLPVHLVKKALNNATSIQLNTKNGVVDIDVFFRRLCGIDGRTAKQEDQQEPARHQEKDRQDTEPCVYRPTKMLPRFVKKLWTSSKDSSGFPLDVPSGTFPTAGSSPNYLSLSFKQGAAASRRASPKSSELSPKMSSQLPWSQMSAFNNATNPVTQTSGTQTEMSGNYGTSMETMESIVRVNCFELSCIFCFG